MAPTRQTVNYRSSYTQSLKIMTDQRLPKNRTKVNLDVDKLALDVGPGECGLGIARTAFNVSCKRIMKFRHFHFRVTTETRMFFE